MSHPFTRRNNTLAVAVFTVVGVAAALLVHDLRVGTVIFLGVTAVQSWVFTLFYGLASSWRSTAAARAVFYVVLAYALLSTHILVDFGLAPRVRPDWFDVQRQFLYLGLAVTGFNLMVTAFRRVLDGRGGAPGRAP